MKTELSLYEVSSHVEQLLSREDAIDPETGEISDDLVEALDAIQEKGASVCAYILNQQSVLSAIEVHQMRVLDRQLAILKKINGLKKYLESSMKRSGISEIKANDGTFRAQLYIERDSSVEILDEKQIPEEFMKSAKPPPPRPSKSDISKAIKEGRDVPGARIVKKDRLTIE